MPSKIARELICPKCKISFFTHAGRSKYCSSKCRISSYQVYYTCTECGVVVGRRWDASKATTLCLKCYSEINAIEFRKRNGSAHPNWKGGQTYWQEGHHGTDPDGLHWGTQRDAALARDVYTCQECGVSRETKGPKWKPHVHHKVPYRVCHSHALDNLTCLCASCHIKADRLIEERGTPVKVAPPKHPPCSECGRTKSKLNARDLCCLCAAKHRFEPRKHDSTVHCRACNCYVRPTQGICSICKNKENLALVHELLAKGLLPDKISEQTGISRSSVYRLKRNSLLLSQKRDPVKDQVQQMFKDGLKVQEVCAQLGISRAAAYRYRLIN